MASDRQINSLPGLLAVKIIRQQISLTNIPTDSHNSPPPSLRSEGVRHRTHAEHRRLKSGPPLMRGLDIIRTVLFLSLN